MKVKYFTVVFILGILNFDNPLFSQNINIRWSEEVKSRNNFENAILLSNGNTIVLKFYERDGGIDLPVFDTYLMLLDKDWNTISENKLSIPQFNSLSKLKLIKSKDKVYLIDDFYRQSDRKIITMAYEIDLNTASINNSKMIDEFKLPFNPNKAFTPLVNQEYTEIRFSTDSNNILVLTYWPIKQGGNVKYNLSVFNSHFEKKWSKTIELPLETKLTAIKDIYFSNEQEIVIAIGYLKEKLKIGLASRNESNFPPITFKFYKLTETSQTEVNFDLKEKQAHDLGFIVTNNLLQIIGLYRLGEESNINGIFISSFSKDLKTIEQSIFNEIDETKIDNLGNGNFARGENNLKGLKLNFTLHSIMIRENGSIDLLCKYFEGTGVLKLIDMPKKGSFIYGDLLNMNLKQDNSITFTRIPKKALGLEEGWILNSYPISHNNKLIVVYNDSQDNLDKEDVENVKNKNRYSNSSLIAAIIDENGNLTRKVLHKNGVNEYFPSIYLVQLATNKFLINAYNLKTFKPRNKYGILEITDD